MSSNGHIAGPIGIQTEPFPKPPLDVQYLEWPPDRLEIIRPILGSLLWLVPPWCQMLTVRFASLDQQPDDLADIRVNHAYRNANMRVYTRFFEPHYSDLERREILAHELLHISVNALADVAREEIKRLLPDGPHRQGVLEHLSCELERSVQDLAFVLTQERTSGGRLRARGEGKVRDLLREDA